MATTDPRIDAYIQKSAAFARPILEHLRAVIHEACPEVEEAIKWSAPHFLHRGRILAGLGAFKQHAAMVVPMLTADESQPDKADQAMGQYGRITTLSDLPARRVLIAQLKRAAKAIDAGEKRPTTKTGTPKPPAEAPDDLTKALAGNAAAKKHFAAFPPSQRREYIEWIVEAKREETRQRRVAQTVAWVAEGKPRNWKYR